VPDGGWDRCKRSQTAIGQDSAIRAASRIAAELDRKAIYPMSTAPSLDADPTPVDERGFAALKAEIRDYVENEGERWTELIEAERQVPPEMWDELRERGYLRLAAPASLGGAPSAR